jgi:hypothetical protein
MKSLIVLAAAAALMTSVSAASAATGRFCVQDTGSQEGQMSKCFKTMAACEKEARGTGNCVAAPKRSTTGASTKSNLKMNDSDTNTGPAGKMQQRKKSGVNN